LNLRPPGPEREPGSCDGVGHVRTGSESLDITATPDPAHPVNGTADKPGEAGFVPIVSPSPQTNFVLPEQLLTVGEAAARLGISRASLYKLCAQSHVAHVRIGNAIRFAFEDLRAFVHAQRHNVALRK